MPFFWLTFVNVKLLGQRNSQTTNVCEGGGCSDLLMRFGNYL